MKRTENEPDTNTERWSRRFGVTTALFLFSIVIFGVAVVGSAGAAEMGVQNTDAIQTDDGYDPGNVTVPTIAEDAYGYGVVPEDAEAEPGDLVRVTVSAEDLGGETDDVTSYNVDAAYDSEVLAYEGAITEASRLREGDDFSVSENGDGSVSVNWEPNYFDTLIDQLGENFIDGQGFDEIPTELFTLEFRVREDAPTGTSTQVDLNPGDDPAMTSGRVDWFPWQTYDNDNIWWGSNEMRIVEDAGEDAVDGAVATIEGTEQGGYVDFGKDSDPGRENAEVTFPSPDEADRVITVNGQVTEDGKWAANPGDIFFPGLTVGPATADIEVLGDGLEGQIDRESGEMTLEGTFRANALGDSFEFDADLTSGDSGELSGNLDLDVDDNFVGSGSARLVDNEFVVPEPSGNGRIDDRLNLQQADESGKNYFVFEFDFNFRPAVENPGQIDGTVESESGEPLSGAEVELVSEGEVVDFVQAGEDGSYSFTGVRPGTYELHASGTGYFEESTTVEISEGDTLTEDFILEAGEPEFDVGIAQTGDVTAGDSVIVQADVENVGDGTGEQTVELIADGDVVASQTVDLGIESPANQQTITLEWATEADDAGTYDLEVASPDDSATAEVTVEEADSSGPDAVFTATSEPDGFISFAESSESTAREEGLTLPPEDEEIIIEGEITDNEWESTAVQFPALNADGIEAKVDVPFGFEGTIDRESGEMTLNGQLEVTIEQFDATFSFDVAGTTGTSGALTGSTDLGEEGGAVTIVDNEYAVDDTTGTSVDDTLGLPSPSGDNWIELNLDTDVQSVEGDGPATGAVSGTIVDDSGEPVDGVTVDVQGSPVSAETGSDGTYELTGLGVGEQTLVVSGPGYPETTATVEISEDATTTRELTVEAGEPESEVEITQTGDVEAGETAVVQADVENVGDGSGEQTVELTADGEVVDSKMVEFDSADATETTTFEWSTEEGDAGTYDLEVTSPDDSATEGVTVEEADSSGPDAVFTATSEPDGFISFGEDGESSARDEGLTLPPEDKEIVIEGEVTGDEWESTAVQFPALQTSSGIEAKVDVPFGFEGTIDRESGEMTLTGQLDVTIEQFGATFSFTVDSTTETSGALAGTGEFSDGSGEITLVDNEYAVDDTTGTAVDGQLGLPTASSENWIELNLGVEVTEGGSTESGNATGTVVDSSGEPIEDATVGVEGSSATTTTDASGEYELTDVRASSQTLTANADGYLENSVDVDIEARETTEQQIELEEGDPEFDLQITGDSVTAGEALETAGTVENVGTGDGRAGLSLRIEAPNGTVLSEVDQFEPLDVGESATLSETVETTESMVGTATVVFKANGRTTETDIEITEPLGDSGPDATFTATNTGDGFISFNEDSEQSAREEGLAFPEGEIKIQGEVYDGEWQSTAVQFPTLQTSSGIEAGVDVGQLSGEIDPQSGSMTTSGEFTVTIQSDGQPSFSFGIDTTTGSSGALGGDADLDSDGGTVTLVDNEYTVDDETGTFVDNVLGLPLADPGKAWIVLGLDLEMQEATGAETGTVEGTITDTDGEPIESATIGVDGELQEATTDSGGTYSLDSVPAGSQTITVDATGYDGDSTTVDVQAEETTEQDAELEAGEPEFDVEIDTETVTTGEQSTVAATVENTGDGPGEEEVTLNVGEQTTTETVSLGPGESTSVELDIEPSEETESYSAEAVVGEDRTSAASNIETQSAAEDSDGGSSFVATSEGGFISFGEGDEATAREEGLSLPGSDANTQIEIVGTVNDDNTWESTSIQFPNLKPADGIEAKVDAPNGLEGQIDPETGEMTANGELTVTVLIDGDPSFSFDIELTSDESNQLSGSADLDEAGGSVTLVDNEFTVEDTSGSSLVDSRLGLPADTAGNNWFELDLSVDLDVSEEQAQQAAQQQNTTDGTKPDDRSAITSLGLLGGAAGIGLAGFLILLILASRFLSLIDPDPET